STLTSLGPRNIITVLQGMLPQLANTTFYFSAADFPAVDGLVALTIDDGICRGGNWSASLLPEVLELLAGSSAKATFFLSSHYVRPKDLRRLASHGHELANHMPEDREYASWPVEEFREALDETDAVLRPFMRADARHWFRAPQAWLTSDMAVVLQARNMSHALGDCYADDWAIPDAFRVASVLLRQVQSGSVAVLHMPQRGFRQHTLEVLRHFLQGLAQRQLRAVTLSQLADAALLGQKPATGGAEDNEGQFSQSNHHGIGVLLALLATSFLCWPQQPRRLLTLSLSWSSSPLDAGWVTAENPEEDFNRWMSNAGLAAASQQGPVSLRDRLALRVLAFAVDVLPPSVLQDYEDELSQVSGIDLAAKRAWTGISEPEPEQCCAFFIRVFQPICLILCESPLTQSEEMIKEALAQQASSGEPLASSGGYSYWGFLPKFVDRVFPNRTTVTWSSRCWQQITASTVKSNGGWVLQVKVSKAKHVLCNEIFGFFTGAHFRVGSFPAPIGGTKTFTFDSEKLTESQIWDVDTLGIRVFTFQENPLATVRNILETALLFVPDQTRGVESYFAKRNVEFLRNYVGASLKPRKDPGGLLLNASDIRSGDFLGVLRLDGLDPMLAWGMGSHTGHTAVAIWEHGQLYVAESTINSSYWPTNGIQRTPYQQWIEQARAAGYSTVHAPLKEEYRSTFDESAANAFFHKYEGLEYGYHAMLTGWIDTLRNNYPCKPPYDTPEYEKQCLTWEFIEVAVPIITRYIPTLEKPFLLTWNQHVTGSSFSNLSATALYREARSKGMELGKIPAVPEPDGILYPSVFNNGTRAASIAMVCDVFVCSMWKAGGVFKAIDNDFSCIEQTNVDVYDLNVLEAPSARKDTCVHADPENPLCQLTGVYGLELPKLGTRPMYRHMCLGNLDPGVL
ncbi:nodB, partial [Symbiodinium necroappetens]